MYLCASSSLGRDSQLIFDHSKIKFTAYSLRMIDEKQRCLHFTFRSYDNSAGWNS